ncbi:MAG TPA: IPT/TIG domain-containing protein, partial [Chryseolinea sp.]|nr:IPT/TIG domain-containing protein [Chryseolinea sp.]
FSLVPSENLVTFGGVTTPALSSTSEELKVKVPHTNTAGAVSIVITVKGISGSYESFVIEGPAIFTVSPSTGYPGRILTITGKNFSEEPTGNKVLFSNYWNATIVQSSQTELRVIIPFPLSINPGIPMDVSVTVTEKVATVTQVFSALSPWRTSPEFGGEARTAAAGFTIGNTGYVGIGTYSKNCHCYLKDFWSFNPLTNIWQRKADFGGPATGHAFGFAINDKGFVAGGYRNTGNNYEPSAELWSYNPASDAWTKKNNLPAAVSTDYSRVFVISNQAHLLIGTQLYQYDDIADQWINKANYPGIASFYQGLLFTINDKAYVSLDGITLYAYDVNSNVWTRKADFPGLNTVNKSSFAINGKGYAGIGIHYGGDFWLGFEVFQYDPIGDTWTQIPGPPGSIQNSIPLNLNGKVYMVTGDQGDYLAHQTLEFNPEY